MLLFGLFAASAGAFAASVLFHLPRFAAAPTVLFGLAGVTASAFIYLVPARPAWNSAHTVVDFHLTGLLTGAAFLSALGAGVPAWIVAALAAAQLLNQAARLLRLALSDEFELLASARLISQDLRRVFHLRLGLLILGGIALTLTGHARLAFPLILAGEFAGRWLFFVSVVPRNMALPWLSQGGRAA